MWYNVVCCKCSLVHIFVQFYIMMQMSTFAYPQVWGNLCGIMNPDEQMKRNRSMIGPTYPMLLDSVLS